MSRGTKDTIVYVAGKLFCRYGFYKTSMDEIAKVAKKAKGSLYYNFESKEELFKEVVLREIEHVKSELSKIFESKEYSPTQIIKVYLRKRMELLSKALNYHQTLKADLNEHFTFLDPIRSDFVNWETENLKKIIQLGIQQGLIDSNLNFEVATEVFIRILKGSEIHCFVQNKYHEFSPHFDDLIEIIIKGIRP